VARNLAGDAGLRPAGDRLHGGVGAGRRSCDIAYFETIAQIIPIVILALAIELRYFAPGRELPASLKLLFRDPSRARVVGTAYAAATLLALVLSEAVALWVLADGSSDQLKLSITTAGLTAGAVALVVAILLPAGGESSS
jgi:hypothetical protein